MKTAIFLLLCAVTFAYYPLYPLEEFETPKSAILILFGLLSFCIAPWSKLEEDKVVQCLFYLFSSAALSTWISIDPHMSLYGSQRLNNGLLVQGSYLVLYLCAIDALKAHSNRIQLSRLIMILALCVSSYAIAQVCGYDFKQWVGVLSEHGFKRPMSSIGHPNFMAAYLSMTLSFTLSRYDLGRRFESIIAILVFAVTCAAILLSQSRGIYWAALFAILCYQVLTHASVKRMAIQLALIASMAITISLAIPSFRTGLIERTKQMTYFGGSRLEYQLGALHIFKKYPITGSGLDTFELSYQHARTKKYWALEQFGSPHRAHNEYLNVLATQGIIGAIAGLFLLLAIRIECLRSESYFRPIAIASIGAFFIQEISSFHTVSTGILLMLSLALLKKEEIA